MRPDQSEYLAQVRDIEEGMVQIAVEVGKRYVHFMLPVAICPEAACVPGGSFYLSTQGVDPDEEDTLMEELLGDMGVSH